MPQPRWGGLYAVLSFATLAFTLAGSGLVAAPALHAALDAVAAGLGGGGVIWWRRANRVALDLRDWCACAGATVRVRVITSRPAWQAPSADGAAEASEPDAAGATLAV